MSKYAWMCNHASPEKERMKECLLVHISVCMLMFLINVNTKLCPGVFFCQAAGYFPRRQSRCFTAMRSDSGENTTLVCGQAWLAP